MSRPAPTRSSLLRWPRSCGSGSGLEPFTPERGTEAARRRPHARFFGVFVSGALLLIASAGTGIGQESGGPDDEGPLRLIPTQQDEAGDIGHTAPDNDISRPAPEDEVSDPAANEVTSTPEQDASQPAAGGAAPSPDTEAVAGVEEEGPSETPVPAPGAASDDGAIVVGTLAAIDPDAAGILMPEVVAFPADVWAGSRRPRIEAMLPRLPVAAPSVSMRRLALALLASPAHPPAGQGESGALVMLRAERLAAMGARDLAIALLERAGPPGGAEASAKIGNDRLLAALDFEAVCGRDPSEAGRTSDGYWRRVRVLCLAQDGLIEAATLGLELLHESDAAPDRAFDDTIYAMAGLAEPLPEGLDEPTPLRVAAWRLAQSPISAETVARASPDVLPAIAGAAELRPEIRLLAVERAEATGALSIEAVRALYREMAFSPEERADPLGSIESLEPPLGRALMIQAIEAETTPALRAELLAAALSLAEAQGAHGTMARALANLVRTVPPAPEHGWFSGLAGRALIAAGDRDGASAWYTLAGQQSTGDIEAARSVLRLWPLMLLGSAEAHLTGADFRTWLTPQAEIGDEAGAALRAGWLVILLDALGGQIDPEVWDRLLTDERPVQARAPTPALALGLRMAAEEGRLGETVLMALLLLGGGGPATADLATVGPVVSSLASVGLRQEAQAIALEAALAAGL